MTAPNRQCGGKENREHKKDEILWMPLYIQRKKLQGVADTIIKQLLCPQMETV